MALTPVTVSSSPRASLATQSTSGRAKPVVTQAGGHASIVTGSASGRARLMNGVGTLFNFLSTPGTLPAGVTLTRASGGTFFNSSLVLTSAANDVARWTYNPSTGALAGLLNEPASTNGIRNDSGVGAVAGSPGTLPTNWNFSSGPGGLARQIVGTGTEDGIPYVDIRYSGTPSTTSGTVSIYEANTQVAAAAGQTWTVSAYMRLVAGSMAGVAAFDIRHIERNGSSVNVGETDLSLLASITNAPLKTQRYAITRLLNGVGTAFDTLAQGFSWTNGVAVDYTVRHGLPTIEQSPGASSAIFTTNAAVTRAADILTVPLANGVYNIVVTRVSGSTTYTSQQVLNGAWVVPTSLSPVRSILATPLVIYDTDAMTWYAAVVGAGGAVPEIGAVSAFYASLKSAGVWPRLDQFGLLCLSDPVASRMSHKHSVLAVNHGAIQIPNIGWRTDGAATYMDLGFVPSANGSALTGTDMGLHYVEVANFANGGIGIGSVGALVDNAFFLCPRDGGGEYLARLNSNVVIAPTLCFDSTALITAYRNGSTYGVFAEGVDKGTAVPASNGTALNSVSFLLGCQNTNGTPQNFRANTYAFYGVGGSITLAQHQALVTAVRAFIATLPLQTLNVSSVAFGGVALGNDATANGTAVLPFLTLPAAMKCAPAGTTLSLNGDPAAPPTYNFTEVAQQQFLSTPMTFKATNPLGAILAGGADATRMCGLQPSKPSNYPFVFQDLILDPSQSTTPAARAIELNVVAFKYAARVANCKVQQFGAQGIITPGANTQVDLTVTGTIFNTTLPTNAAIMLNQLSAGNVLIQGSTFTIPSLQAFAAIYITPTATGCTAKLLDNTFTVTVGNGLSNTNIGGVFIGNIEDAIIDGDSQNTGTWKTFTFNKALDNSNVGGRALGIGTNVNVGQLAANRGIIRNYTINMNTMAGIGAFVDGENQGNPALMNNMVINNVAVNGSADFSAGAGHAVMNGRTTNSRIGGITVNTAGFGLVDKAGIGCVWDTGTLTGCSTAYMVSTALGGAIYRNFHCVVNGPGNYGMRINSELGIPSRDVTYQNNTFDVQVGAAGFQYLNIVPDAHTNIQFADGVYNQSGGTLDANPWQLMGALFPRLADWKTIEPTASGTAP